jgi:hypothetical protein
MEFQYMDNIKVNKYFSLNSIHIYAQKNLDGLNIACLGFAYKCFHFVSIYLLNKRHNPDETHYMHQVSIKTVFLELLATTDHYMGARRRRGPLSYRNITLSRK